MEQNTLHIISHSHWDREWYLSFEQHRMRLVELFDSLIETMENHPDYKYFHLDGQFVVIEDYLEIRPQMKDRLQKLIRDDRIQIGPWYVLQDEYLTSGEANVRNMLYGLKLCRSFGADPVQCGYFPDSFGNVSQIPQILRGFDMDCAVFGRGIGAFFANQNMEENSETPNPSELIWRSPDGSEVMGILFVNWYHNAMELPTEKRELKERIDQLVENAKPSAHTPHLLGLNGCDHQPVQRNVYDSIALANEIYGDQLRVIHSNFKDYIKAVAPYQDRFPVLEGEINGQRTSGATPLVDTASTHVPLKQQNHRGQNALEKIAEPISVIAMLAGDPYREDQLFYAWRKLMQNHPHDSICTCSCDEVARQMVTRFDQSLEVAQYVTDEAMRNVADSLNTSQLGERNIVVFHTSPSRTVGTVTAFVDYPEDSTVSAVSVVDENGQPVPCSVKDLGRTFTFTLPKDRFRQPAYVKRFAVTMLVDAEGIGYRTYRVKEEKAAPVGSIRVFDRGAENEFLSFVIEPNGSLTVTDKRSGMIYQGNNVYEDVGDVGESYHFRPAEQDVPITTLADTAAVWVESQTDFSVTFGIENHMAIPACAKEKRRVGQTLDHTIRTFVTLTDGVARIDVTCCLDNQAKDHRFRALFTPEIVTDHALAEGQFDVVPREIVPYPTWQNPCYCQRIQTFVALDDDTTHKGLMIAVRGLNEYEILRDGRNTMALTLLRCIGEIGDWGDFPTPDAQCIGQQSLQYSIIPFSAETRSQAIQQGFIFNGDPLHALQTGKHDGTQPAEKTLVIAKGDEMAFCAFKKAEDGNEAILRFYNTQANPASLALTFPSGKQAVESVNLAEQHPRPLTGEPVEQTVPAKKIVSYKIRF